MLIELFQLLASHISQAVPEPERRKAIGRTLFGVRESAAIEEWVREHARGLVQAKSAEQLLSLLWPVLIGSIRNSSFRRCSTPEVLLEIGLGWISSTPFYELLSMLQDAGARIGGGERPRHPNIDHVVDMCENALAYEGNLLLGAIIEIAAWVIPEEHDTLVAELQVLQKRLKYGLPSTSAIMFHEIGFADRIVANDLAAAIGVRLASKKDTRKAIRGQRQVISKVLGKYPAYFTERLAQIT